MRTLASVLRFFSPSHRTRLCNLLALATGVVTGVFLSAFMSLCGSNCTNCVEHPHVRTLRSARWVHLHNLSSSQGALPDMPWKVQWLSNHQTAPVSEPWDYYDGWDTVYNGRMEYPSYHVSGDTTGLYEELSDVKEEVVRAVRREYRMPDLSIYSVTNAYIRRNPLVGNEYIFDVELSKSSSFFQKPLFRARVNVKQLLAPTFVISIKTIQTKTVNFIVPFSSTVASRLEEFMKTYHQEFLSKKKDVRLVIAVYGEESAHFARREIEQYQNLHPEARMEVVQGRGKFERGKARHLGMSLLKDDELAFLCDVDIKVNTEFIERCQRNAVQSERVYFPEVFKMYNLDYVYRGNNKRPDNIYTISRSHGHWGYYGYGMVCIYKSDYLSVGGMSTSMTGWGGEDVDFFHKVAANMEVLQAPDPALFHRWHTKNCPSSLSRRQQQTCYSSKYESLADRIDLAHLIYDVSEIV